MFGLNVAYYGNAWYGNTTATGRQNNQDVLFLFLLQSVKFPGHLEGLVVQAGG